jgi:hypothetical protein
VELAAYAVAHQFPHDAVAVGFCMMLNGITDIACAMAGNGLLNAELQAFLRYAQKLPVFPQQPFTTWKVYALSP